MIGQSHLLGENKPLKVAIDSNGITRVLDNRYRYSTNTEAGSSGSPVFNGALQLIALHHAGDPDFERLAHYNQGVPIHKIVSAIKHKTNIEILT